MQKQGELNWDAIRDRAQLFPEEALEFVRDGLAHTVQVMQARSTQQGEERGSRHVSGQELCEGLRDLAIKRYGLLARTVLRRWGVLQTADFGTIVFALIDRGELRASEDDSIDHFRNVFVFDEAFPEPTLN